MIFTTKGEIRSIDKCEKHQNIQSRDMRVLGFCILCTQCYLMPSVRRINNLFILFVHFFLFHLLLLLLLHFKCKCYAANYCEASFVSTKRLKIGCVLCAYWAVSCRVAVWVLKRTQSQLVWQIEPSAELLYNLTHEMVMPAFNRANWHCNGGTACRNSEPK